jgi:hypothetical protein
VNKEDAHTGMMLAVKVSLASNSVLIVIKVASFLIVDFRS